MELSVLTYNIHKGIGNDRLYRLNRTIEVLKTHPADIILLQEVDYFVPRSRKEDTARIIAEELNMNHCLGLNVKLKTGSYGNATLTKFPIIESSNRDLTWGIKKKRGCLFTKVMTPAGEIMILNYHLGLAGIERTWQIKKLIQFINKTGESLPVLLSGDTNDRNHKLKNLLEEAGLKDSCNEKKMATYPAFAPIWRLDKIHTSPQFTIIEHTVIKNKLTRITSDHLPVRAVLKFVS